ncbi:MAG: hypothetical protein IPM45_02955 [Acidimicrobiales bacterium]|nr:hypothetical protein [Acidimicrobiales bacterium]
MTETDVEQEGRAHRGPDLVELLSVVLLGVAAILTAFTAFQASLKDGEALSGYTESNQLATLAADLNGQGDVVQSNNEQIFLEWSKAVNTGDEELAAYIQGSLMTDDLASAIAWWADSPDEFTSPFVEENPDWVNPFWEQGADLQAQSEVAFQEGQEAGDTGDTYGLAAVFFAVTLFFGGVANVFKNRPLQLVILGVAAVALGVGTAVMLSAI